MRLNVFLLPSLLTCVSLCALSCSKTTVMGGGGTEWEAKISGRVVDSLGSPFANARVVLVPAGYDPVKDAAIPDSFTDTTNLAGEYSIHVSQTGDFNLVVAGLTKGYRALVTGLAISRSDSAIVHDAIAREPGSIKITLPPSIDSTDIYFFVPGTTIFSFVHANIDSVVLDSVPADANLAVYYSVKGRAASPALARDSVTVAPGGIIAVSNVGWMFSRKLVLNTSSTGASVAGTITNFPVLVRLSQSNFSFGQARFGGDDIRFAKQDGTPLQYQIDRWDSTGASAEIWVRMDTVYGNNATQAMVMYWGNPSAASQSNGVSVFDTASGFQGVWHLGESSGGVLDATANHYNGTFGGSLPKSAAGAIGMCQVFNGTTDYIGCGNVLNIGTGSVSISAWAKRARLDTIGEVLVSKSNGSTPVPDFGYSFAFFPATTFNFAVASDI